MDSLNIQPSSLVGTLKLPPSKSHTMRALLFGAMGKGMTRILNPLESPDTACMIQALRSLGVTITTLPGEIRVEGVSGKLLPAKEIIDAGNSGQVLRFVGCLAALLPSYTILTGDHSIRHSRPVMPLLSAIEQLNGFAVSSQLNGHAPIIVRGPIEPGSATMEGKDSQPVSAVLIAASFLHGTTELHVTSPSEKPWIDLTLSWLKKLGGKVTHRNYEHYIIEGNLSYEGFEITIPGDLSSAAFPLITALLTPSSLTIENIELDETQGDKKIVDLLVTMGADLNMDAQKKSLSVRGPCSLNGAKIDAGEMIDAIPILAVLGCFTKTPLEVYGGAIARKKESDRIAVMVRELKKMGAKIEEREDGFIVTPTHLRGARLSSHSDHRVAMALTVAAMASNGESRLEGVPCIAKSYPTFISDYKDLGARLS